MYIYPFLAGYTWLKKGLEMIQLLTKPLHRTAPIHLNTELPIVTALVNSYVKKTILRSILTF